MERKMKIPPELQVNQSSLHHRFVISEDQKLLISKHQQKQYYQEGYSRSGSETRYGFLSTPDLILKSQLQMAEQEAEEEKEIAEERRKQRQRQQQQHR